MSLKGLYRLEKVTVILRIELRINFAARLTFRIYLKVIPDVRGQGLGFG